MRKAAVIGLLAASLILISTVPAAAASAWSTPADLSSTGVDASNPQVAIDTNGAIVSVWASGNTIYASSSTDKGVTWGAPAAISTAGSTSSSPQIVAGPTGIVTVVWASSLAGLYRIETSRTANSGDTWIAPVVVATYSLPSTAPQIDVDDDGGLTVVWEQGFPGPATAIVTGSSLDGGLTWNGILTMSSTAGTDESRAPQVATTPDEDIILAWSYNDGSNTVIQTRSLPFGTSWQPATTISAALGQSTEPQLTVDSTGRIVAVWTYNDGTNTVIQSAISTDVGATWTVRTTVSNPAGFAETPQIAAASDGTILAVWVDSLNADDTVYTSRMLASSSVWSAPAALSPAGADASSPQIAAGPSTDATVVWSYSDTTLDQVNIQGATTTDAGVAWGTTTTLTVPLGGYYAQRPQVAVRSGLTAAVWSRYDPGNLIVQATTFTRPAAAPAGQQLAATGSSDLRIAPLGVGLIGVGLLLAFMTRDRRAPQHRLNSTRLNSTG